MRTLLLLLSALLFGQLTPAQQNWKAMKDDPSVNFYDVCKAADEYFATHDKGKGSGYKGYMRWRSFNEPKYYPTGDRTTVDERIPAKAYARLKKEHAARNLDQPEAIFSGWNDLGPYFVDSITDHYAPGLGRVESYYIHESNTNIMYLGSRSGGFWKTTDGGANWIGGVCDTLPGTGVNTIAVNPNNKDSILINVRNANNGTSHGIYRSTDGGATWTATPFNPTNLNKGGLGSNWGINKIYIHRSDPDLVFVTATDGLYRSSNNLTSWTKLTTGSIDEIEIHPTNDDILYIYDYYYWGNNKNLILRSTDRGLTWNTSGTVSGNNNASNVSLAVSPDCPNCVWFGSQSGIWVSQDTGKTFQNVTTSQTGTYLVVHDLDADFMYSGGIDVYHSNDGGQNFSQVTWWSLGSTSFTGGQYVHADLREGSCINGVYYLATDGYLAMSPDTGVTWVMLSEGTGIRENYRLGVSQSNHYRTVAGSQDNGTSVKHESVWLEAYGADGMEGMIHPLNDDLMMSSWQNGGRLRSDDGGIDFYNVKPAGNDGDWIAPMFYDPNNHMRIYSFNDMCIKTDDWGANWTYIGGPSFSGNVKHAQIAENNSNVMFAARNEKLEKSTDGGVTWSNSKGSLPGHSISDIAFDPNDDNTVIVTYARYNDDGDKVFISHDQGSTWTNITYNLNDMPIRTVVVDHSDSSYIYLGAEIGVYVKSMNGTQWELYNKDLPNVTMRDLEIVWGSNTLRGSTWGRGCWEYHLKDRKDYPAILHVDIDNPPTDFNPKAGVDQNVTAEISYNGNLSSVYLLWSVGAPTFDSLITFTNTVDSTWTSDKGIPGQTIGTHVFFKVFAVGTNGDTTETYKFMYEAQEFKYCSAAGAAGSGTGADWINYVELANMQNQSLKMQYFYYANKPIYVWPDSSYQLEISMNYHWEPDTTYGFFDWNKDAEFADSEIVYMSMLNSNHESFGTVTVPTNAVVDDTIRFRARSQYFNNPPAPCGVQAGEVEDYPVIVMAEPGMTYNLLDSMICQGSTVGVQYTGGVHDSLVWSFSNGNSTMLGKFANDFVAFTDSGTFDLTLTVYKYGMSWQTAKLGAVQVINIDTSVSLQGPTLTAAMSGVTYRWLDCSNGMQAIAGETSQSFTTTMSGLFAAEITANGCVDTSACYNIMIMNDVDALANSIRLYPNPTDGIVNLEFGRDVEEVVVSLFDQMGKELKSMEQRGVNAIRMDLPYPAGVYFLSLDLGSERVFRKVVIE